MNNRYKIRISFIIVGIFCFIFFLYMGGKKPMNIEKFTFSHQGKSKYDCYTIGFDAKNKQMTIKPTATSEEFILPWNEDLFKRCSDIVSEYHLDKWNGFNGNNTEISDGKSFQLLIKFEGGKLSKSSGHNCFPTGYHQAVEKINQLVEEMKLLIDDSLISLQHHGHYLDVKPLSVHGNYVIVENKGKGLVSSFNTVELKPEHGLIENIDESYFNVDNRLYNVIENEYVTIDFDKIINFNSHFLVVRNARYTNERVVDDRNKSLSNVNVMTDGLWYLVNKDTLEEKKLDVEKVSFNSSREMENYSLDNLVSNTIKSYALVSKQEKMGVMKCDGEMVVPMQFDDISLFDEMALCKEGKLYHYYNLNASISKTVTRVQGFYGKYALVSSDGEQYFIDRNLNEVENTRQLCKEYTIVDYNDEIVVYKKEEYYGIVTVSGKQLTDAVYTEICLSDGVIAVNKTSKIVPEMPGKAASMEGGKWEYLLVDGTPLEYTHVLSGIVQCEEGVGYMDSNGQEMIACKYYSGQPFIDGVAIVEITKDTFNVIDSKGKQLLTKNYDKIVRSANVIAAWSKENSLDVYTIENNQ